MTTNQRVANLRMALGALIEDYPKAVEDKRLREWEAAVVAIVRFFAADDEEPIAPK